MRATTVVVLAEYYSLRQLLERGNRFAFKNHVSVWCERSFLPCV